MAGIGPHRRPLQRALRWDGFFPIASQGLLAPDEIASYLDGADRPPGWELFAARVPGVAPPEFEAAGVSWLVDSAWPTGEWVKELSGRIADGPQR